MPETLPVSAFFSDADAPTIVDVPVDEYPLMVAIMGMSQPTIVAGYDALRERQISVHFMTAIEEFFAHKHELAKRIGARHISLQATVDRDNHRLLLAKIGHCFAVAKLGLRNIEAYLPKKIRKKDCIGIHRFVGEHPDGLEPNLGRHHLSCEIIQRGKLRLVGVNLRLFPDLNFPSHRVIAGRLI
jgi:hypothetical protein